MERPARAPSQGNVDGTSAPSRAPVTGSGARSRARVASFVGALTGAAHPRVWLVVAAFLLRLIWVLAVPSRPVGDFALYREAAAYLVEHGHLDPEFIYMPGYVFLLAGVQMLGGGLLAQKLVGVLAGTLIVASAGGIADRVFGRRAGIAAAAIGALWPAGVAVSSVTGTDVPAGALVAAGLFALVSGDDTRTWRSALAAGIVLGLAAWVRAVGAPLGALAFFYWLSRGLRWPRALAHTALGVAVSFLMLLPWGARNHRVYGEFFLTDSHGGHTALVGANPNSEGAYSRSLNVMFTAGTGYRLMDTPARHRASDAAAYALAKRWTAFEPTYALGLLGAKADRLLTHERNLLYWPIFRAGVLSSGLADVPCAGDGVLAWFQSHRGGVERIADAFWWGVVGLCICGLVAMTVTEGRRAPVAFALLLFPLALTAIYVVFFSEVRYHLAIAPLLFPYAAYALVWFAEQRRAPRKGSKRCVAWMLFFVGVVFLGYPALLTAAEGLRARHRWAVSVCQVPSSRNDAGVVAHLCEWRRRAKLQTDASSAIASDVRGIWNGVGLRLSGAGDGAVETDIPLDAGQYRVRVTVACASLAPTESLPNVVLRAGLTVIARADLSSHAPQSPAALSREEAGNRQRRSEIVLEGSYQHAGPLLRLDISVDGSTDRAIPAPPGAYFSGKTLWITDLSVERFPGLGIIRPQ